MCKTYGPPELRVRWLDDDEPYDPGDTDHCEGSGLIHDRKVRWHECGDLPWPLDQRDQRIIECRRALHERWPGPQVGDFVRLQDGSIERIAHVWADDPPKIDIQLAAGGGRYHLGLYGCGYSGSQPHE